MIRGMSLVGSGGAGWYTGTVLRFPTNTHGIICKHIIPDQAIPGGDWSIIERCQLEGPNDMAGTAHGIILLSQIISESSLMRIRLKYRL